MGDYSRRLRDTRGEERRQAHGKMSSHSQHAGGRTKNGTHITVCLYAPQLYRRMVPSKTLKTPGAETIAIPRPSDNPESNGSYSRELASSPGRPPLGGGNRNPIVQTKNKMVEAGLLPTSIMKKKKSEWGGHRLAWRGQPGRKAKQTTRGSHSRPTLHSPRRRKRRRRPGREQSCTMTRAE